MYLIKLSKIFVLTAYILCIWTSYKVWVTPVEYNVVEIHDSGNGAVTEKNFVRFKKFSDISSLGVVPLLVPAVIVFLAVLAVFKFKSIALCSSVLLMLFFWFVAGFSIGMAYLPVVILLILTVTVNLTGKWLASKSSSQQGF